MNIDKVILSSAYGLPYPLNAQSVFDKAALHLIQQGSRSLRKNGGSMCGYRGFDGTACAVGALIPAHRYVKQMEGEQATSLANLFMPELKPFAALLEDIQDLHDNGACGASVYDVDLSIPKLLAGLRRIASKHGLSASALPTKDRKLNTLVVRPALPAEITGLLRPSLAKTEA